MICPKEHVGNISDLEAINENVQCSLTLFAIGISTRQNLVETTKLRYTLHVTLKINIF